MDEIRKRYDLNASLKDLFRNCMQLLDINSVNIKSIKNYQYLSGELLTRIPKMYKSLCLELFDIHSYINDIKKSLNLLLEQNTETQKTFQEMIKMFKVMSDKIDSLSERVNNIETRVNKLRIAKEKEDKEIQTEIKGVENKKYTTTINMLENREKDGEILGFDDGKDYKVPEIIMIKGKTITREKTTLIPTINKVESPNIPVSELTPRYVSTKIEKYNNECQEINILNSRPYSTNCVKSNEQSIVKEENKNNNGDVPLKEVVKYDNDNSDVSLQKVAKCDNKNNDSLKEVFKYRGRKGNDGRNDKVVVINNTVSKLSLEDVMKNSRRDIVMEYKKLTCVESENNFMDPIFKDNTEIGIGCEHRAFLRFDGRMTCLNKNIFDSDLNLENDTYCFEKDGEKYIVFKNINSLDEKKVPNNSFILMKLPNNCDRFDNTIIKNILNRTRIEGIDGQNSILIDSVEELKGLFVPKQETQNRIFMEAKNRRVHSFISSDNLIKLYSNSFIEGCKINKIDNYEQYIPLNNQCLELKTESEIDNKNYIMPKELDNLRNMSTNLGEANKYFENYPKNGLTLNNNRGMICT